MCHYICAHSEDFKIASNVGQKKEKIAQHCLTIILLQMFSYPDEGLVLLPLSKNLARCADLSICLRMAQPDLSVRFYN